MNEPTYCVKQTYALWNFKIEKKKFSKLRTDSMKW